jgi:hypothetical protein
MYDFLLKLFKTKENLSYTLKLAFFLTAIISFVSFISLYIACEQNYILKKYLQQATEFENPKQASDFLNSKLSENLGLTLVIFTIIALAVHYYISKLYELLTQKETKPLSKREVIYHVRFLIYAVGIILLNVVETHSYIRDTNAMLDFLTLVYSSSFLS